MKRKRGNPFLKTQRGEHGRRIGGRKVEPISNYKEEGGELTTDKE